MTRENVVFGYPVILNLSGKKALVVGAGPVGANKIQGLVRAGAEIRLVAPVVDESVDLAAVSECHRREFRNEDLEGVNLVITATGNREVDLAVSTAAQDANLWVNAADQVDGCSFILPAVARNGRVSLAVSTDGASPALAIRLRDLAADTLVTEKVAALASKLGALRRDIHRAGQPASSVDWNGLIDAAEIPKPL